MSSLWNDEVGAKRTLEGERKPLAFNFSEAEFLRLGTAADAVALPKAKPRAIGQLCVVPLVGCRDVARLKRTSIRGGIDDLQPLDIADNAVNIHRSQYSEKPGVAGRYFGKGVRSANSDG